MSNEYIIPPEFDTAFWISELVSMVLMPVIIKSSIRKKKQILDPLINSSYS